jgi:hypothetical protein
VSLVGLIGEVVVGTTDPKRAGEVRIAVRGGSETFIAYCTEPFDSAFDGVGDCGTRQSTRRCHPVDVDVGASSDQEGNDARLPRSRAREAMLISGGKSKGAEAPFRVVTGRGAFDFPLFRKVRFITLSMSEAEVEENRVTKQGIALKVKAVIAFKVGNDTESIVNASQRFLSDQSQMSVLTGRIWMARRRRWPRSASP